MTNQPQTPHAAARPPADPWAATPVADPWAPAEPGSPHGPGSPNEPGSPNGVGSLLDGDRRRLAAASDSRGGLARALRALFTADRTPEVMAERAAQAQAPVATGRRIAVVSTRGGAGKTTVAALLGRLFSAVRPDTIAVLDLDPGHGSLGLRLGTDAAPAIDDLADRTTGGTLPTASELSGMLGHAAPNLFATGPRARERAAGAAALREACSAVSRYFPVTLLDCPTGFEAPATQAALADCHAAVFAVPATLSGLDDALAQLARWRRDPRLAPIPLVVVVMQQDRASALGAPQQAARLARLGFDAYALGYDRHLAAGADVALPRLAPRHRVAAATIAAKALELANGRR